MSRRVFALSGLAILSVVWSHAAGWGQIAMIYWADRYRPVSVPSFDQVGSLAYYVLLVIRQLNVFAVPAFLFVSGFFVAYAARGNSLGLNWKLVRVRITHLLIPYFIWSLVIFLGDALQGNTYAPLEYVRRLVVGSADGSYFYVPLLCQFYLLAPLMVPIAKTRTRLLLCVAGLVQLVTIGVWYLPLLGVTGPALRVILDAVPGWAFFRWAFFFPLGLVSGFQTTKLQNTLLRFRPLLLATLIVLGVLAVIEPEAVYRTSGQEWRFVPLTISTALYSVAVILCFLGLSRIPDFASSIFYRLGSRSYGVYLLHQKAMELAARLLRQAAPAVLAHQVLVIKPLALAVGLGAPLLFMLAVAKSPLRRFFRYLFG